MPIEPSFYVEQLQREGHQDVHLETGADGEVMIVCVLGKGWSPGHRVCYRPETDLFEPLLEPKAASKRRGKS